jgi:hypothetical protein
LFVTTTEWQPAGGTEVTHVAAESVLSPLSSLSVLYPLSALSSRCVAKIAPSRRVHLYSRPHIDLQRVAGALCRR